MRNRPISGPALVVALVLLIFVAVHVFADGSVVTPPVCEQVAKWKLIYNHENVPVSGAPNALVTIAYLSATDVQIDAETIVITGADFAAWQTAQITAATGEVTGWTSGRKKLYRASKWLVDNAKLTKCPSCTVVG